MKELKKHYVILRDGIPDYTTISIYRKVCIKKFLNESRMTWEECQKYGWKCSKVDITFKEL